MKGIYVVVQFYPWFKFDFPSSFLCIYMIIIIKQRKIKIEPTYTRLSHYGAQIMLLIRE